MSDNSEKKIYLTLLELTQIELNSERVKSIEKDIYIDELKIKLIETQKSLLDREEIIIKYSLPLIKDKHKTLKIENDQFLLDISDHYEHLKGKKWKYNPETGEIILDE